MESYQINVTRSFFATLCVLTLIASLALAQDPVKVAGGMYKVVSENDRVRILDVNIPPGAKTVMHSHPDLVAVVLEPSTIKWATPDGTSRQSGPEFKRGGVQHMTSEMHISENIGKTSAHVILVEFKQPAPAAGKGRNPSLPAPYKQVADNPHARVFELMVPPGGTVPQHTHGNHVEIALTDATGEVTNPDGTKQTFTFKKDTAVFAGPATHSGTNIGKAPLHLVVIELK